MALIDLILRRDKEAPLLNDEVDSNFENLITLNNELAQAEAQFYGDVDPATITGLDVGPGFVWAHRTPKLRKRRNDANDDWVVEGPLFSDQSFDSEKLGGNTLGQLWNTIAGESLTNQNGYTYLPNSGGLSEPRMLFQWGNASASLLEGGELPITLPIAFPNIIWGYVVMNGDWGATVPRNANFARINDQTLTRLRLVVTKESGAIAAGTGVRVNYIAWGS